MKMLSENISQIRQCYKLLDEIKERKDVEDGMGEQECESVRGGRQKKDKGACMKICTKYYAVIDYLSKSIYLCCCIFMSKISYRICIPK